MKITKKKKFGMVMSILKFNTMEEAMEKGDIIIYGLEMGIVIKITYVTNRLDRSLFVVI